RHARSSLTPRPHEASKPGSSRIDVHLSQHIIRQGRNDLYERSLPPRSQASELTKTGEVELCAGNVKIGFNDGFRLVRPFQQGVEECAPLPLVKLAHRLLSFLRRTRPYAPHH